MLSGFSCDLNFTKSYRAITINTKTILDLHSTSINGFYSYYPLPISFYPIKIKYPLQNIRPLKRVISNRQSILLLHFSGEYYLLISTKLIFSFLNNSRPADDTDTPHWQSLLHSRMLYAIPHSVFR